MEELIEPLLRVAGVGGALIVGKDGLVIAQVGSFSPDAESFGVAISDVLNSLEALGKESGVLQRLSLEQAQRTLQLTAINEVSFLVAQAGAQCNLGRLRLECDRIATVLQREL